jgi:hypothetical protein
MASRLADWTQNIGLLSVLLLAFPLLPVDISDSSIIHSVNKPELPDHSTAIGDQLKAKAPQVHVAWRRN